VPWLRAGTRWQAVAAGLLLDRAETSHVRLLWPLLERWERPEATTAEEDALRQIGELMGRGRRVAVLLQMADWLTERPGALEEPNLDHALVPGLPEHIADLAVLAVPVAGEEASDEPVLVTRGVLRVASRFIGEPVDRKNKLTDGRLAVARMIGGGTNAREAHLGLIELASTLCRPVDPVCTECPLAELCVSSKADTQRAGHLF
jgi:DNA (cytosine-5)-methyltransferase 1